MAIKYLTGYTVKPYFITNGGVVLFTDGTNSVNANQQQCEAYGYTYNKELGICMAFTPNSNLSKNIKNENNRIEGSGHTIETGTNNTHIIGENNTVKGLSRNNIIGGSNNEISNGVNNATVVGNYGLAQRDGEFVVGGGGFSGTGKGYSQNSVISLTGTTSNSLTPTPLFVNGDSSITTIKRNTPTSSILGAEAKVLGVRTGGTAGGSVNDRIFLKVEGLIYDTRVDQTTTTIDSFGTVTGWTAEFAFHGSDLLFQVTGVRFMDISWSCTLNVYEIKV